MIDNSNPHFGLWKNMPTEPRPAPSKPVLPFHPHSLTDEELVRLIDESSPWPSHLQSQVKGKPAELKTVTYNITTQVNYPGWQDTGHSLEPHTLMQIYNGSG